MAIVRMVCLFLFAAVTTMVFPQASFAQEGSRNFTSPHLNMDEGYATIRVTGRASFREISRSVRQTAWMRGERDALLANEEDFARENPGRIIHLCRTPTERPRMARDPAVFYEGCDPSHRARWLVQGLTYRIPIRREPPSVAEAPAVPVIVREPERRDEAAVAPAPIPPPREASSDNQIHWKELIVGFLGALGILFILFAFVRRGMQKRFARDTAAMRVFAAQNANAKNAILERKLEAKDREIELLVQSRERLEGERDAVRKSRDAEQREKNQLQQAFLRLKEGAERARAQLPEIIENVQAEVAQRDADILTLQEELTRARQELDTQAARISAFVQAELDSQAHLNELHAHVLVLEAREQHRRETFAQMDTPFPPPAEKSETEVTLENRVSELEQALESAVQEQEAFALRVSRMELYELEWKRAIADRYDLENENAALRSRLDIKRSPFEPISPEEASWESDERRRRARPRKSTQDVFVPIAGEADTGFSPRLPTRLTVDQFSTGLTRLVDELEPLDEAVQLKLDRATSIDFVRFLSRVQIEDPGKPGTYVPLTHLPYFALLDNGGRLPPRIRERTIPPPPGNIH